MEIDALLQDVLVWVNEVRSDRGMKPLEAMPPGLPCQPFCCPVSAALGGALVLPETAALPGAAEPLALPAPVRAFVAAFDVGAFPQLEVPVPGRPAVEAVPV